ncbi:flp pilus-assembly TadE/G-like family protein [Corynebacterium uropygiale]|uniref:Flp pilus-assembly TadE/G-like family protein n=1 Tax=Corynebacterium uropygiale TaxID=1775911 RepID=A0A9X1QQ91_9CORY|nr:Rv3654c family TadE-like protein [Corynebacterium uropygiale]MCF4005758.1 flp pilus-assembly TadE/G-like family protein [Corynebacterium uropygiale]
MMAQHRGAARDAQRRRFLRGEEGSATVAAASIILVLSFVACLLIGAGVFLVAQHRARSAADMAAVSAAWALYQGEDACAEGRRVSELNGATLRRCTTEGADVILSVSVRSREAESRAGPL